MALVTVEDLGNIRVVSTVRNGARVIVLSGRLPGPDGYYRAEIGRASCRERV